VSVKVVIAVVAGICLLLAPYMVGAMATDQEELAQALRAVPDPVRGAELFRNCAVCHGPSGGGTLDGGVPRIGGQHMSVLAKELVDYRHDRRWDIRMEHFADNHHLPDPQAIADVASYASHLSVSVQAGVGDGELLQRGTEIYARRCSSCHGTSAGGDATRMIPRIAGQHYGYLLRQIYDAVDGRRPNFSRSHVRLFARLERADIVGLSDYLSRLSPPLPPATAEVAQVPSDP